MYFRYGGYSHTPGEVNLEQFEVQPKTTVRGKRAEVTYRLHIRGELQFTPAEEAAITDSLDRQQKMSVKINALLGAYNVDGFSGGLVMSDGTPTNHYLDQLQPNIISPVRVAYRSWPRGAGDEYVTARTYYIILEADFDESASNLYEFRETLLFSGLAGPAWEYVISQTGAPLQQQLAGLTTQTVIQSGLAVGSTGWPLGYLPPPLWPAANEHQDRRRIVPGDPKFFGVSHRYYPLSWTYVFEFAAAQSGVPTLAYV
jgi:hypothetical protein